MPEIGEIKGSAELGKHGRVCDACWQDQLKKWGIDD